MTANNQFKTAANLLMEAQAIRSEALNPDNAHVSVELMLQVIAKENEAQALLKKAFGVNIPLDPSDNDEV